MTAVQHTPSPNPVPAKVPGLRTASLPPGWSPGWSARRCPTVIPAASSGVAGADIARDGW